MKRTITLAALCFSVGCSTTASQTKPDTAETADADTAPRKSKPSKAAKGQPPAAGAPAEQHPARATRAFDDAVAASAPAKGGAPDYADLERRYKQVISIDDTYAEAHYNLGVVYEREHKPDQAEDEYKKALAIKPTLAPAQENLAVMQEKAGKSQEASDTYQKMAAQYPQDGGSRARLAALYQAGGQNDEAQKLSRDALMRDPKNLTAYKVLMKMYLEQKNYSMAQLFALRATKLDSADPELYYTIGLILLHQGDEPGAQEQFRKAVATRDDYLPARMQLATISVKHHDWAGVAAQYTKIVQVQPKSAAAHLNLGIAYRGLGQPDKAQAEYEQVKKLDDTNAEVYYAMGLIQEKAKSDPAKALEDYKEFVAKAGTLPGDHPVYESIKNCEQILTIQQQAKDQEASDKQAADAAAKQKIEDDKQKAAEAKEKAAADKQAADEAKQHPADPAPPGAAAPAPAAAEPAAPAAGSATPPPASSPKPVSAKPAASPGSTAPPAAAPAPTPAPAPAAADEPGGP